MLALAEAVKSVADELSNAPDQVQTIQVLSTATTGADLRAADGWAACKIQGANLLPDAVDKGTSYALAYLEALAMLGIYGQSLCAAQLGLLRWGRPPRWT